MCVIKSELVKKIRVIHLIHTTAPRYTAGGGNVMVKCNSGTKETLCQVGLEKTIMFVQCDETSALEPSCWILRIRLWAAESHSSRNVPRMFRFGLLQAYASLTSQESALCVL